MTELPPDRMIPILPCLSTDDQIDFYEALGFEVTYRQKVPNVFASVQRGAIADDLARADELLLSLA